MRYGRLLLGVAASALWLGAGNSFSYAQTTTDTSVTGLETVIVTARKRAEDAQSVPIAITALNQNDLDQLHIETIQDLSSIAPSVTVEPSTFRQDTLNITIRGQRNFDSSGQGGNPGLSFDTASAVYLDGVYYARAFGLTGALLRHEQRGRPQRPARHAGGTQHHRRRDPACDQRADRYISAAM